MQRIVNLSQLLLRTGEQQATEHQTHHWLSEQLFDTADVGAVHLNGVVFFENLRALARPTIAKADALLLPWGPQETVIPMVSAEDTARVAAAILTGSGLANGTIVPLIGEAVRMSDMASDFSAVLGGTIRYREISDQQWQQMIAGADVNPVAVKHLTQLWRYLRTRPQHFQRSYKVSDAFESIAGIRPNTLRQFLQEHTDFFQHAPPTGD